MSNLERLSIMVVVWLATALCFVSLEAVPPALNVDEALNGYEAYSLLRTGRDEWGNPWPVIIRGFNDYRRPAIVYAAIPFVAVLGLSTFSIRATTAAWGLLHIVLTYRLARDMLGRWVGVLAALILALLPWHLSFSRIGFETTLALCAASAGLLCVWRWFRSRRRAWLVAAGVVWGLSFYTYTTLQAFVPLMLAACGALFARQLWRHKWTALLALGVMLALLAPLAYSLASNPDTWNRLETVSIYRPGKPLDRVLRKAGLQWLGHFSPAYLFTEGDGQPVVHPPGFGQLYAANALLLPLGVLGAFKARRRAGLLLLAWIALGAVPAAVTVQDMGTPHSMRGMLGLPAYAILSAQGFVAVGAARRFSLRLRSILLGLLAGWLAWNALAFVHNYFVIYPLRSARAFEYGVREALEYASAHEADYPTVVLTDWISQPHIFALFFQRYDPARFQALDVQYGRQLSVKLERWDKYRAGNVDELYAQLEHGLFVARPHMLPGVRPALVIYHPDGSPAFNVFKK